MLVIGGTPLLIRVNVKPTAIDAVQENYGTFTICQPYRRPAWVEFPLMEIRGTPEPCPQHG